MEPRPRYLLVENVKGFEVSETHQLLVQMLQDCSYSFQVSFTLIIVIIIIFKIFFSVATCTFPKVIGNSNCRKFSRPYWQMKRANTSYKIKNVTHISIKSSECSMLCIIVVPIYFLIYCLTILMFLRFVSYTSYWNACCS